MTDPGSAISISLEDVASRIRAIVGRRAAFPAADAIAQTGGPSGGSSAQFAWRLQHSANVLSRAATALGEHLEQIELLLSVTGEDLVATDESVASDVQSLQAIADSVVMPTIPGGSSVLPTPAPPGAPLPSESSDDDAAETFG